MSEPTPYLFKLIADTETVICDPEPIDWASGSINMKRDLSLGGVFSSFMLDSLTFVGNSADLLRRLFSANEVNAQCALAIYWFKNSTREYVEFPSRYNVNFNTYEVVKVGKLHFGIRIKAVNTSEQTKFESRKDLEIDLNKDISVGGVPLMNSNYGGAKLKFYEINVSNFGRIESSGFIDYLLPDVVVLWPEFTSFASNFVYSDFPEMQGTKHISSDYSVKNCTPFFKNAKIKYENISIDYSADFRLQGGQTMELVLIEANSNYNIVNEYILSDLGGAGGVRRIVDSIDISVESGNSLFYVVRTIASRWQKSYITSTSISIRQQVATTPARTVKGYPIYTAFHLICQRIIDKQFAVYSDFFGLDGMPYSESETYQTESVNRFAHLVNGMSFREFSAASTLSFGNIFGIKKTERPSGNFTLSFKNLFQTAKTIWNVGYCFENGRIRIEPYSYFFKSNVIALDLSDRIGKYDIQSAVMMELIPVGLKSGFESYEYFTVNGLSEPNTSTQWTSPMRTDAKYENISPFRGDTKGIFDILSIPQEEAGSKDTKNDKDVFIIKTRRTLTGWKPETDQEISIDENSSVFKNELINRYFTPTRMLRRHGNRIRSGMMKVTGGVLRFQTSDKLQNLKTTGEGYTCTESEDIAINDLSAPIYRPIKHTVECYFDWSDLESIQLNPTALIKFSNTISGYLLSLKKKNDEARAEITIIERYVS
jgi:hypothetical protein